MQLLDEDRYEAIENGRVNEKLFKGVKVCSFVRIDVFKEFETEILLDCDVTFLFG